MIGYMYKKYKRFEGHDSPMKKVKVKTVEFGKTVIVIGILTAISLLFRV